ncbi:Protein-tyrosine phosphatase [Teladorsagia circumcincta]|uniref:Protein-tyrosine phosphatase n=1 Tax=Teladorsagia circumcincta TaxID=45464 RepID=A0A2G9ULI4_TELCI|nr:Protein-tyrosine phosphatase [Teladorsagia circumcincta]
MLETLATATTTMESATTTTGIILGIKKTKRQTKIEKREVKKTVRDTAKRDESATSTMTLTDDNTIRHAKDKSKYASVEVEPKPPKAVAPEVEKAVADFVKYTTETAGVDGLRKECRIVLDSKPKPGTYNKFEEFPQLNRYPEIPCLDETRVILQQMDETDYDYIHANKVKFDKSEREFILTQGPKGNTIEDFWKMIFQIDHQDQYDVYTLEVLPDGCSNSILTRLAHCTTWPEKPGPITLLCSAGVGRTGTFVAIDAVCTRLFKGFEGNVKDIVLELRRQRAYCIHNELQYFFVYSTVLDYIRAKLPKYHKQVAKFYTELSKV